MLDFRYKDQDKVFILQGKNPKERECQSENLLIMKIFSNEHNGK